MTSITKTLSEIVGSAFEAEGLDASLGAVRVSDRPDLCQFQCNGAMAAAKAAKKNPREVAEGVLARLQGHEALEKLEIAGPGFINIDVKDSFLNSVLADLGQSKTQGVGDVGAGQCVVLDYGGPNIAKPMHVGHLRSSIIGDALRRMYVFAGYKALGDVHMGDWGTQMGQIISELEIRNPGWPYFDPEFDGAYPDVSPVSMQDLEEIYPAASAACKEDRARAEKARAATVDLQGGRRGYRALWEQFIAVSIAGMKANFDALGVHFDLWKGEADAHPFIADMVEDLKSKGLAVEDDGALVVHVARADELPSPEATARRGKKMPPLILYKSDGAVMYGTTDLATIVQRVRDYHPVKIVYVVDQRQSLHFEQVFRAAEMGNILPENTDVFHAGFGTMNGPDGKPFKTRAGGVMKLDDLIAMAVEKAQARLEEADLGQNMDSDERADVARKVALAAIKFADLQNPRQSDYIFDLDKFMAFEGKTGPYLLYQAVRIRSLLRKAEEQGAEPGSVHVLDQNRPLGLILSQFSDQFQNALAGRAPHILCEHAYSLAQVFSSFYGTCHILSEENEKIRASHLRLCEMVLAQLETALDLLGISVPERM